MVNSRKQNPIPDRSSPGSTRTASVAGAPGQQSTSGQQGSVPPAGRLVQATVQPPEGNRRKFWTVEENRKIMESYYKSNPSVRGFQKRMFKIWKEKFPDSTITEQRLMDQRRFIIRNKMFTDVELCELENKSKNETATEEMLVVDENISGTFTNTIEPNLGTGQEAEQQQQEEESNVELTEYQQELKEKILKDVGVKRTRQRLLPLKRTSNVLLKRILHDANIAISAIPTETTADINQLMYSTAKVITAELGYKLEVHKHRKFGKPKWKIRLQNSIKKLRADISNLKNFREKKLKNEKIKESLQRRYHLHEKSIKEVTEQLKQRVVAISNKIKRYEGRVEQFKQNSDFRTNQHRFFKNLAGGTTNDNTPQNRNEIVNYWRGIWDKKQQHNKNASWIKDVEKIIKKKQMDNLTITKEMVNEQAKKARNWTAPGKDEVHGFWLKHLTCLHARLAHQFNKMLQESSVEEWMTSGKTFLITKHHNKGTTPSNFRPITCLPTTFKLLTGIISNQIYYHLQNNSLYPIEQKGNFKNSQGTKDQLLIDKTVLRNCKRRKTNLYMAWIDYKKAFDSLPHCWIEKCLEIFGVSHNIRRFLKVVMMTWKTSLLIGNEELGEVNIRRGIFQGDSLSPLLFNCALIPLTIILNKTGLGYELLKQGRKISHLLYMDDIKLYGKSEREIESLLNTVRIFSDDIKMEFGIDKCAMIAIKRGKVEETAGIKFKNGEIIKALDSDENYKYLGILEANDILHAQMKKKTSSEYIKRVRKILKSKLNGGNIIKAINTWAIPVIRYTAGIINWTQADLDCLDRKTRKMMNINRALHPRSDVDRLYLPRNIGGRGLLQVKQVIGEGERALKEYIEKSREEFLKAAVRENILKTTGLKKDYKNEEMNKRKENWISKNLHGQYLKDIEGKVDNEKNWAWLRSGSIKKETEGLILAAQEQALQTNVMKAKIEKISKDSKCRLCKEKDETVDHLISGCSKIAQTDYKQRHDRVANILHWHLCRKYGFPTNKNWWDHKAEKVLENNEAKILWDFRIQTDRHLQHNTPDITIVEKKQVQFIDVAIPGDSRIDEKELEKITKYKDLCIEVGRIWKKKARVIPIVIGALGAIPKALKKHVESLQIKKDPILDLQRTTLLGTAHILRRYLDNP